jgi:hypothetical protein
MKCFSKGELHIQFCLKETFTHKHLLSFECFWEDKLFSQMSAPYLEVSSCSQTYFLCALVEEIISMEMHEGMLTFTIKYTLICGTF